MRTTPCTGNRVLYTAAVDARIHAPRPFELGVRVKHRHILIVCITHSTQEGTTMPSGSSVFLPARACHTPIMWVGATVFVMVLAPLSDASFCG